MWLSLFLLCWFVLVAHSIPKSPGNSDFYFQHWCGGDLEFLDDAKCVKAFPSDFDRDAWKCLNQHVTIPDTYSKDRIATLEERSTWVDGTILDGIPYADSVNIALILIRRSTDGQPFFRYVSNGRHATAYETWSSSKVFVVANAATMLENVCDFGLDAHSQQGNHGPTQLGDLLTIICSYDETAGYSSNSLAKYFSNIGSRQDLSILVNNWLGATGNSSLGGSYGEAPPTDLGNTFCSDSVSSGNCAPQCKISPDTSAYPANSLSQLALAELTRRLALHREILPQNQFPQLTWGDIVSILYGARSSGLFGALNWGGMAADTAIFVQSGISNMTLLDQTAQGQWRIHSKLGAGYSTNRKMGEILSNNYACFPVLDAQGLPVPDQGVEFVITARASVPFDYSLEKAQHQIQSAIAGTVQLVMNGTVV